MHLKLLLPHQTLVDRPVEKIIAHGADGAFCLLPRHQDWVSALVPGLLIYTEPGGVERLLAVDEGTLVKCGADVFVSVFDAVEGDDLQSLRRVIADRFEQLNEQESTARSVLARLEAGVVRRFVELQ